MFPNDTMTNPFSDTIGQFSGVTGSITNLASLGVKIAGVVLFFIFILVFIIWRKNRKSYNIPVTIWIPRSDGKLMDELSAKGGYFRTTQRDGGAITTFRLKRKGLPTIDIPPPASRFLVGLSRKLYLVQKGVDDFEAVLPDSFRYVETPGNNKKIAIINLKCINQDATAWVEDNRENAKKRFTFSGFWDKYKDFIQMTMFIFIVMLAIYINWQGLKDVTVALQNVADSLGPAIGSTTVG